MSLSEKDRANIEAAIKTAMADAWADICSDTDCWPADIQRVGRGPVRLEFSPSTWTDLTASWATNAIAALLQAAREEAYKEGWNDREDDLIAGVNRIAPEEASQGAGEPVAGKAGGFAPGSYECRCLTCGNAFEGDKRAISCRPCAEKALPAERLYEAFRREMKPSWPAWKDQSHAVALAFHRIVSASPPPANDRTKALEEALEALKPFADAAFVLDSDTSPALAADDDMLIEDALWPSQQPTVGDLRKAREAYAALSPVQAVKGDDHG